jgi:membrane dipeptidase
MIVVDGHLDIAFNHLCYGRDVRQSARATRDREGDLGKEKWRGLCMVGLPELRRGRVAILFGTIFLAKREDWDGPGDADAITYRNAAEAEKNGRRQLQFYRDLHEERAGFRVLATAEDLAACLEGWKDGQTGDVGIIPLLEGADPISTPENTGAWREDGLRIVGLAWRGTRYSGGTGAPGPLTRDGAALVDVLSREKMILDLSHAAEESFFQAIDRFSGPLIASHSNPRALCPGDRQLSDEMIRRIASRDGVIGIVPFNRMLDSTWPGPGAARVPLERIAEVAQHLAGVAGTHKIVAIGSDFDGGFGAASAPQGLDTIADLPRIGDVLSDARFSDAMIADILGGNWIRLLEKALPRSAS